VITLGIIGCGDVAFRTYFPGIEFLADRARVVAVFDPATERAERAAARFPGARVCATLEELLADDAIRGVLNLTPAPFHRTVNEQALRAGRDVFSEKPLTGTVEEGRAVIALAEELGRLLLCAPAVMATRRFRWLKTLLDDGAFGRPTLATAQMANMGPAGWADYTGDPAVFYTKDVGPLLDTGVYVLHAITGLFGPATRVQAFGGIAIPERTVSIPSRAGETIQVQANDQMLLHVDFGNVTFAQILSSFAVPASRVPSLEVHGATGSLSLMLDDWYDGDGPTDLFRPGAPEAGPDGWQRAARPPDARDGGRNLIGSGPEHFVDVLLGTAEPVLTAAHALHVLEIIHAATTSAEEARVVELETAFGG